MTTLAERVSWKSREALYRRFLAGYRGTDIAVLRFCLEAALQCAMTDKKWDVHLRVISRCYLRGASFDRYLSLGPDYRSEKWGLNVRVAKKIVREFKRYPLELVRLAEEICHASVARNVVPVGKVATRDGWFDDHGIV